jgi:hypothetical protein
MESKAEKYRRSGLECREEAARAKSRADRQRWLKLAAQWEKMAKAIERGANRDGTGASLRRSSK